MRRLIALCCTLAVAATVSWVLSDGDEPAPPPFDETVDRNRGDADVAAGSVAAADVAASASAASARPPERTAGSRPADLDGPLLQVLRSSGAPAADAEVFYLSVEGYKRRRRDDDGLSRWDAAERFGQRTRADADGRCHLPTDGAGHYVAARDRGEFGYEAVGAGSGDQTLRMRVDEEVSLAVTFPDGAPAAVPVALLQQTPQRVTSTLWRGDTDRDGRALVRHFQLLRRPPTGDSDEAPERFGAMVRLPTTPLTLVEFTGRPAPAQTVRLQVPDLGQIRVALTCHSGQPLLSPARVGISSSRSNRDRSQNALRPSRRDLLQMVSKPAGPAPVTLPYAQVGRSTRIYARYPNAREASYSATTAGPAARGDALDLTIRPRPEQAVLAGRMLDEDGEPLAAATAQLVFWRDDQVQASARVETLADGRWDCVLRGRAEPAAWRVEVRCDGERTLGAFVPLQSFPGGRRTELGEVRLAPLPPLCAGVVIDGGGAPIAGARVIVEREVPAADGAATRSRSSLQNLVLNFERNGRTLRTPGAGRAGARWRQLPGLQATTDADGAFAIYAEPPPGKLRVRADTDRHFRDAAPLVAPDQDLRIRLLENGIFTGEVALPTWLPDRAVTVLLQPVDPARRGRDARSGRVSSRRDGAFRIEPLRAGRYDLLVKLRGLRAPLTTLAGVVINPGENRDPRVAPLDLSEALHRYRLRALDEGGAPMDLDGPILARLQAIDGSWSEAGFRWRNGRAELITAQTTAELTFFGRGFVPQRRRFAPGEHDVYLQTQQPARVMLPGARALSGSDRKVRISAILKGDTGYPSSLSGTDQQTGRRFSFPRWDLGRSSGGWLGDTDLIEIPLMQEGDYELIFRAHANETTRTPQTQVSLGTFKLTPGGAVPTTVPVPADGVAEALRTLDEQWRARQAKRGR